MKKIHHRIVVISDLHIGGIYPDPKSPSTRGFRICTQTPVLGSFIRGLASNGGRTELVINGDFLDFLAEEWEDDSPWVPFISDPFRAAQRLRVMIERDRVVFDAMKYFLQAGNSLTIILGNHDVELSLPIVRETLRAAIDAADKNFRFICDGEAYVVGPVLIEHGNRYDRWNVVDHDALRRTRSAQSRKEVLSPDRAFVPPAGSLMVSAVMNRIKKRYPFVDLLKPEKEATLMLLLTLAPEYRSHLLQVAALAAKARSHRLDEDGFHLYAGDVAAGYEANMDAIMEHVLASRLDPADVSKFLDCINKAVPVSIKGIDDEISLKPVSDLLTLVPLMLGPKSSPLSQRLPALLASLKAFRQEQSFDRSRESEEYLRPAQRLLERGFKVVVFGHTHLAKKVVVGDGLYLNTGTWADLMRFPYERIDEDSADTLEWLDQFATELDRNEIERYLLRLPTYAQIDLDDDGAILNADIYDYKGAPS